MKRFYFFLLCAMTAICAVSCRPNLTATNEQSQKWHGLERAQRYEPDGRDFKIVNGKMKFNRALYGTNTAFRIEAGDLPEFAFYMPGMGGNCQLALTDGKQLVWLNQSRKVVSRYRPGAMIYEITDPLLQQGKLTLTAIAMADEEGLIVKADFTGAPEGLRLVTVYGGASDKKFSRSGDLNADPADCFYMKAENCLNNHYVLDGNRFSMVYGNKLNLTPEEIASVCGQLKEGKQPEEIAGKKYRLFTGTFPANSTLSLTDANGIEEYRPDQPTPEAGKTPVILAQTPINNNAPLLICLHNPQKRLSISGEELPALYEAAESKRAALAGRLVINTPDSFINTLGGVISMAGDAIYEHPSYLHGAISWRMRLNGWRGAYVADVLGWHDRAKNHFSAYAKSQLTTPVQAAVEMDTALNLTRSKERLGNAMFSRGYICRNPGGDFRAHHYDMNLVFVDQLLNHFAWTGDLDYLREMWPLLERHLAWEKRVFDPDGDGLYDAYACIWASDGLMYNGGGVTHSSAYNYKANKIAAELAARLGKDPRPYRQEAQKIHTAMQNRLWLPHRGQWAEFVDGLGNRQVHPAAGLWTVYHAIDSEVPDRFEAYQALRYIDTEIPHIPLDATGFEGQGYYLLSTTNWLPYSWSVNNVAFAELMHTALAYWQGGRADEGFRLWKSTILDAMYCGLSPGNIGQISFYDAARGETYRDFADPTGMAARTVVEGLFGIRPDMMNNRILLRPGFPQGWEHASVHLPYIDFAYRQEGKKSVYTIAPRLSKPASVVLEIPARREHVLSATANGKPLDWKVVAESIGQPFIRLQMPAADEQTVEIQWQGDSIYNPRQEIAAAVNELNVIDFRNVITDLMDPQQIISDQEISDSHVQVRLTGDSGEHTFFARQKQGAMSWWQPVHVHLGKAVEIIPANNETPEFLCFYVRNNSERDLKGKMIINPQAGALEQDLTLAPKTTSELVKIPAQQALKGSNVVEIHFSGKVYDATVVNWEIPMDDSRNLEPHEIAPAFNDRLTQIFENRYLSPRSSYTTLQLPAQGLGEWCHPKLTARIDDSGLRKAARNNLFTTPFGMPFRTPADSSNSNIAFVSLWDNYPDSLSIPLKGKASHAYFLMAGTTNHMQSQFDNGEVNVVYKDGSRSVLTLRNPETWAPIERDYFVDGYAFAMKQARPYRVVLQTGEVARNLEHVIRRKKLDERYIPGGGAIILDLPLHPDKELDHLELRATANDVVIGMMGVTLRR